MSGVLPFFACYVIGDYLFVKVVSHMLILIFRKIFQNFLDIRTVFVMYIVEE